jgi:glutaminyl-tRNA synthetase
MEPYLSQSIAGDHFQFLRKGYFVVDEDSNDEKKVFNLTVSLKEGW